MLEIDVKRFNTTPYPYQLDGLKHILSRPFTAVFDEQGVGKTKQTIDASCVLYDNNEIDTVIVVAPSSVRGVWDDNITGEVKKHCWKDYAIIRYDSSYTSRLLPNTPNHLLWITISYSFLRSRLTAFLKTIKSSGRSIFLVLDESSYVKSHKAQQSKACWELRQFAKRCVILNGTPYANSIMDYWMQFNILDPAAIKNMNYYHYRAKYAIMQEQTNLARGTRFKTIVGFKKEEVEELKEQLAPYIIRRELADVAKHLPEQLPPVYWEVPLSESAWKIYQDMKEKMVAWLDSDSYSKSVNAAVKSGRLTQITSGFLGGLSFLNEELEIEQEKKCQEIDTAKLDWFLEWRENNPHIQVITWCRYRAEMFRLADALEKKGFKPGLVMGGMGAKRDVSIAGFKNKELTDMVGHPASGGFGLNLTNCHTAVYMSMSHSLIQFLQSRARIHRVGQELPTSNYFILATGPKGQKTFDHQVVKAVLAKEDMSTWSMNKWKASLI